MSSVADIPLNQFLGVSYDKASRTVSLPGKPEINNYFGQTSFCAQFALAEAASAQYLFDLYGMSLETDMPTLRHATTKFFKPTSGESICNLVSLVHTPEAFQSTLDVKGKILTSVKVEVVSSGGVKSLVADFQWLVLRKPT